ncbi:hypothetical protein RHO14_03310 [Orbus wheelerorum]|uniref:hypothetical protein n=1 Tax=Orbus wheelerorum TaxID=3074111 RepID=UPI00370D03F3
MMGFIEAVKIILDKFLMSDFIFTYKAKFFKNGIEFGTKETKKICKVELDYLVRERISKTYNREMADYFIGLSEFYNHSISPCYFKKLYPYLIMDKGKPDINQDNLKKLKSTNASFKILGLLFMALFVAISFLSSYHYSLFFIPIYGVIMLLFLVLFRSQIVSKRELSDFNRRAEQYNDQLKNK